MKDRVITIEKKIHSSISQLKNVVEVCRNIKVTDDKEIENVLWTEILQFFPLDAASCDFSLLLQKCFINNFNNIVVAFNELEDLQNDSGVSDAPPSNTNVVQQRPIAPPGLLSLSDYTILQASIEIMMCWGICPVLLNGVGLPISQRIPTKTLKVRKEVLLWVQLSKKYEPCKKVLKETVSTLYHILFLPQFKAILLKGYIHDLLAILIQQAYLSEDVEEKETYQVHLKDLLDVLPLNFIIGSLRHVLLESQKGPELFRQKCTYLLSQCVTCSGGVQATIDVLLSGIPEGHTQAYMHVASLLATCPKDQTMEQYLQAVGTQICDLLSAVGGQAQIMRLLGRLIVSKIVENHPYLAFKFILRRLLEPLLRYESPLFLGTTHSKDNWITSEDELLLCLQNLEVLLAGTPTRSLLVAVTVIIRPLMHLYSYSHHSQSHVKQRVLDLLLVYFRSMSFGAIILLNSLLSKGTPVRQDLLDDQEFVYWDSIAPPQFVAGTSGGVAIVEAKKEQTQEEKLEHVEKLTSSMVYLLSQDALGDENLLRGDLFVCLMECFVQMKHKINLLSRSVEQDSELLRYEVHLHGLEWDQVGNVGFLQLLVGVVENLGPVVLQNGLQILNCIQTYIAAIVAQNENNENEMDLDTLSICLGLVSTIVEAGAAKRPEAEENVLRKLLPSLEVLSQCKDTFVAEMALSLRVSILTREYSATRGHPANEPCSTSPSLKQLSYEATMESMTADLKHPLVPLRARAIVRLTRYAQSNTELLTESNVHHLISVFLEHLGDKESYVYLAAVQGLATLSNVHHQYAFLHLVMILKDSSRSCEQRIKIGEALLFGIRRRGEVIVEYAKPLVYAFLAGSQPPPGQQKKMIRPLIEELSITEVALSVPKNENCPTPSTTETLEQASFRAGCLSNLSEVCGQLKWAIHPYATDVITCALGVIECEVGRSAQEIAVRRGAIYILQNLIEELGSALLQISPEQMKPIYHTLKHVENQDVDDICKFHASRGLRILQELMHSQIFVNSKDHLSIRII